MAEAAGGQTNATTTETRTPVVPPPSPATNLSPAVVEILKLIQARVSTEVIRTYIEACPVTGPLSAADVIVLKDNSVTDDLITALLKRGAGLKSQPAQGPATAAPSPAETRPATPRIAYAGLGPESYDFWWYHYAYPRALASANQRLFFGGAPGFGWSFYPYGYYYPRPLYPRGGLR